jgi:periplasmic copper chaperone A
MNSRKTYYALAIIVLLGAAVFFGLDLFRGGAAVNVENAWARPSMAAKDGSGTVSGIFMVVSNGGKEADRLIGGVTAAAEKVEVHETIMEGEVAKMQQVAGGLEIPAGGSVMLKPGGYHVMLIGIKQDLKVGDKFSIDLQFEKSGTITLEVPVKDPTQMMP